jgi:hypothetical protein
MVNLLTVVTLLGCYLPLAGAGYLLYSGADIPSNMLTKLSESSLAVLMARLVMGCLLFGTYSLFIIPLRRKLEIRLYSRLTTEMYDARRLLVAVVLMLLVLVTSIELRDLGLANALAGGCLGLVMLSFPGAMILHGERKPNATVAVTGADDARASRRVVLGYGFLGAGVGIAFVGLFGATLLGYWSISLKHIPVDTWIPGDSHSAMLHVHRWHGACGYNLIPLCGIFRQKPVVKGLVPAGKIAIGRGEYANVYNDLVWDVDVCTIAQFDGKIELWDDACH